MILLRIRGLGQARTREVPGVRQPVHGGEVAQGRRGVAVSQLRVQTQGGGASAGGTGGPTAIKQANLNHQVFQVGEGIPNLDHPSSQEFEKAIRAKYDFSLFYPRAVNEMRMLAAAADKAKSTDPVKVAAALEGMEFEVFDGGKGNMRKDDHQFFQPIYISSLGERTDKEPFDEEKTGWGWKLVAKIDTPATVLPTTCKMERPN